MFTLPQKLLSTTKASNEKRARLAAFTFMIGSYIFPITGFAGETAAPPNIMEPLIKSHQFSASTKAASYAKDSAVNGGSFTSWLTK